MEVKILRHNYSQKLEMQIPQENIYTGLEIKPTIDEELKELSKYYSFRKINNLKEYLKKDERLIPYIKSITPTIMEYFPKHRKYLTYCIDPEFKDWDSVKICVIGNDSLFEQEHELMNKINDEILNSIEYPIEVKNLISVRMWWL